MKLVYNARKYYLTCHIEGYIYTNRQAYNKFETFNGLSSLETFHVNHDGYH